MEIQVVSTKEETQKIASLAEEIWTEHYTPIIGAKQVRYMLENLQSSDNIWQSIQTGIVYWLLEERKEAMGYLSYQLEREFLFLSKFYLRKEARGKGLGKAAFTQLEQTARAEGRPCIRLTVNRHNTETIAVYKKLGFLIVKEQKADIGQGYVMDDFVMEKRIGS